MRRFAAIVAGLIVAATLVSAPSAAHGQVRPADLLDTGSQALSIFNDPEHADQQNLIRAVERNTINGAGDYLIANPEIRASLFHITDQSLATALLTEAHQGVVVQVLLDGSDRRLGCGNAKHCINPAYSTLTHLNTIGDPDDWLRTCDGVGPGHPYPIKHGGNGCIGSDRNHNKFILVSSSAYAETRGRDIVIQTSSNNTPGAYTQAYNDAFVTINQPAVYGDYLNYFRAMTAKADATSQPSIAHFQSTFGYVPDNDPGDSHEIATWSFPRVPHNDPMATSLAAIPTANHCASAATTTTSPTRSGVDIAMSQISGRFQLVLQLARLKLAGCDVQIVYAHIGRNDFHALHNAGVGLHRMCLAGDPELNGGPQFVHSKFMLVAGTMAKLGSDVRVTYTGSANFDDKALRHSDDRVIRYVEPAASSPRFTDYQAHFHYLLQRIEHGTPSSASCTGDD